MIHSHCGKVFANDHGYCKHFRGGGSPINLGLCTEVEGEINPVYWCKEFSKAHK